MLDGEFVKQTWDRLAAELNGDEEIPESAKRIISIMIMLMKDVHLKIHKISEM